MARPDSNIIDIRGILLGRELDRLFHHEITEADLQAGRESLRDLKNKMGFDPDAPMPSPEPVITRPNLTIIEGLSGQSGDLVPEIVEPIDQ